MQAVVVLLLLGGAPPGALPPKKAALDVQGDTVLVVRSFPVVVSAPTPPPEPKVSYLYDWAYPAGVDAAEGVNSLTIKSAPAGVLVVSVKVTRTDFNTATQTREVLSTTLVVGGILAPPKATACASCKCATCPGKARADARPLVERLRPAISAPPPVMYYAAPPVFAGGPPCPGACAPGR